MSLESPGETLGSHYRRRTVSIVDPHFPANACFRSRLPNDRNVKTGRRIMIGGEENRSRNNSMKRRGGLQSSVMPRSWHASVNNDMIRFAMKRAAGPRRAGPRRSVIVGPRPGRGPVGRPSTASRYVLPLGRLRKRVPALRHEQWMIRRTESCRRSGQVGAS